ncbi:MAG: DNA repair protein RecN [Lachnospiraceae bacterium]|nr:DNA repair protein RecN [Lachnospiraceae bacterium]
MLSSLHIENLAVIRSADIDFESGFTVMTGETGAGKSMIIGAINLLLGEKASKDAIRSGEEKAVVSGLFRGLSGEALKTLNDLGLSPDEDGNLLLQRTVSTDGRSQSRLNGRTIPLSMQKEVAAKLVNIHGQHDTQTLMNPATHLAFLDSYADDGEALAGYEKLWESWTGLKKKIGELTKNDLEKERTIELLKYQIADIDSVKPVEGEDDELTAKKKKIMNGEKIRKQASVIYRALYENEKGLSASDLIGKAVSAAEAISDYLPDAAGTIEKLREYRFELSEIGQSAGVLLDEDEEDADTALDKIESRLNDISKLKRKYGATVTAILEYRDRAKKELNEIELSEETLEELNAELAAEEKRLSAAADRLTAIRREAAASLEKQMTEELVFLEMGKVRFSVSILPAGGENGTRFRKNGADEVEFLISANAGEPLRPMSKIASGGELSRIMLAIKSVEAGTAQPASMIFDARDTGASEQTAQKIGVKLRLLAEHGQVLCVTHSAQIAAVAHRQDLIRKGEIGGRTETEVIPLDREGRIREIARIMGGAQITEKLLSTAEELLSEYNR